MDVLYYLIKTVLISAIVGRVLRHCSRSQEKAARLFDLDLSTTPAKFSPEVDHGQPALGLWLPCSWRRLQDGGSLRSRDITRWRAGSKRE